MRETNCAREIRSEGREVLNGEESILTDSGFDDIAFLSGVRKDQ